MSLLEAGEGAAGGRDKYCREPYCCTLCMSLHDGMKVQTTHHLLGDAHTRVLRVEKENNNLYSAIFQ